MKTNRIQYSSIIFILTILCSLLLTACIILGPNTKVLSKATTKNLTSISQDGSTLTFSQSSSELRKLTSGDIIVSSVADKAPNGFLRKVSNVSHNGNEVVVETIPTSLEEAIEKGTIEFHQQLTPNSVQAFSALKGVNMKEELGDVAFELDLDNVVLYDLDGDVETTNDQIRANGGITFSNALDFMVEINHFSLKKVEFINTVSNTAELQVDIDINLDDIHKKVQIAQYTFGPYVIYPSGFPVVITPIITVFVGYDGEVSIEGSTRVAQAASFSAGLRYEDGDWSPVADFTNDFDFDEPTLDAECGLQAYVAPNLTLLLYGVIGPYGDLTGYLRLAAKFETDLSDPLTTYLWWGLYGGYEVGIGVKGEILSWDLFDYYLLVITSENTEQLLYENKIIVPNTPPTASIITPLDGNSYEQGESISFSGSGSDLEDGNLTGGSLVWSSSIDGQIGTGTAFSRNDLSGGNHTITLTVTDSGGLQATDTCVITISSEPISALLSSMVSIPSGTFQMGSTEISDAQPVHAVTLQGFEIGAYEVTQAQYVAIMGSNPSYFKGPGTENNPVESVTWYEAREFCTALSALTGRIFTLPSEAQWEYACRAGSTTRYSFGDDDGQLGDYAWYWENSGHYGARPVGTKLPNAWGLYDMSGNVWEWCLDSWHDSYDGAPYDGSAWEPETGLYRMERGGDWDAGSWRCRSADRPYVAPDVRHNGIGFRVVAVPAGG